ncbi:MAG: MATE family efflux transporter [Spirochaetaceae bacterium]|nr:MATE family efflux transporter [Spirochaetaceae bacterium]
MKKNSELKTILILGFPLLAGRLSHYFHTVTDSMMLGHFKEGSQELAAIAVAGMFIWIFNTFLWPLGNGVQAITTRREGEESIKENRSFHHIGEVLDNGLFTALLVAFVAIIGSFSAYFIIPFLISDTHVADLALQYINIMRWAFIPFGFTMVLQRFFSSIHKTRYVMFASVLSNGLNILLNYFFIFGKMGFPALGIEGAAWGTVISQVVSLGYMLLVFLTDRSIYKYRALRFKKIQVSLMKNIIRLAFPLGLQNSMFFIILLLYESMVENQGAMYLAAIHVAFSAFRINKTIVGGFAHAGAILVGNALGAGDYQKARKVVRTNYQLGLVIGLLAFCFFFFMPETLAKAFSSNRETLATMAEALRFFSFFYLAEIIGFSFEMIFGNNGWAKFVLYSELMTNWVFIIGFSFLMNLLFPGNYTLVWLGFGLYQIFHSLILHGGYLSKRWINVKLEKD